MNFCIELNVLIFLISYFDTSNGNFAENLLDLMFRKRLVRGISETAILDYLEKYVAKIDIESFAGDYYLVQFVDYNRGVVTFHHVDPLRQMYAIYAMELDLKTTVKKDVFVLKKNEDHIKIIKEKKIYVVLRRVKPESTMFYVSYLYVKEPHDPPSNTKEIGGENYELEWDLWDHKGGKEYKSQLFGHTNCKSTIFVPCKAEETKKFPPTTFGGNVSQIKTQELNFATAKISLTNIGDDVDADIDFFYDLDDDLSDSRYVGEKILNLTKRELSKMHEKMNASPKESEGFLRRIKRAGRGVIGSFVNMGANVAGTFVKVGMGFVKNFGGLFGGLGTKTATLKLVAKSVDIQGEEGAERWMEDSEMADILAELQQDTSGGLGGLISPKEGTEKEPEVSEAQFQAARGLLDFLPENGKDSMPDNIVEQVVDAALNDFIDSSHPGWKTMGVKVEPHVTLRRENEAFFGFSPCPVQEITSDKIKQAKSPEKLVELILQVIGTQCIKDYPEMISNLFAEGFVVADGQNAFQINPDLKPLNQDKLSTDATLQLLQAFEFAVFSDVYYKEASSPTEILTAPDGSKLSHSVFLIGKYIKKAILTYRKSRIRVHCVKIRRHLVKTLKSFLVKLIQDKIILQKCELCNEDETINYNDSVYIMGLTQFIFRGLSLSRHGEDFDGSFNRFYITNKSIFEGKVKSYYI